MDECLEEWCFLNLRRRRPGRRYVVFPFAAHPHAGYGIESALCKRIAKGTQQFPEADGIKDAQGEKLVDVPRRRIGGFVIGKRARGGEVAPVAQCVCYFPAHLRGLPKRETSTEPRAAKQGTGLLDGGRKRGRLPEFC